MEGIMGQPKWDLFYHQLRETSNTIDRIHKDVQSIGIPELSAAPDQNLDAARGLANHLLSKSGDYDGLMKFLDLYGYNFIAPAIQKAIEQSGLLKRANPRFIDLGSGSGWLARYMKMYYSALIDVTVTVDKRQWYGVDVVADVETEAGLKRFIEMLEPGDIIIMSEFLHCISNPALFLHKIAAWPVVISEYFPVNEVWDDSWRTQLKRMGGEPLSRAFIHNTIKYRNALVNSHYEPHHIWIYDKEEKAYQDRMSR